MLEVVFVLTGGLEKYSWFFICISSSPRSACKPSLIVPFVWDAEKGKWCLELVGRDDLADRHLMKEEEKKTVMIMTKGLETRFGHLMNSVDNLLVR